MPRIFDLNKRGGVLIGDVVGLGKSMMATALAKIFEDDYATETLILCPKNLVSMWEDYVHRYRLHAKVMSLSKVLTELPEKTRRYRIVLVDESHNLRNKGGKRWRAIRHYIDHNDSLCILLSATPYNKTYRDLSAQILPFLREDSDIGIRPERLVSALGGEHEFIRRHQCPVRSLAAFDKSEDPDDWRDLMRLYMVRRTRGFIMQNYAREDERGRFLQFPDGRKSYFPRREPKNVTFTIQDSDLNDAYARFYSGAVVNPINALVLPRYGLGNYLAPTPKHPPNAHQERIIAGLSRAGTRLMGFCRTNLFKRLESAGPAFLLSIERHILRNFIVLHSFVPADGVERLIRLRQRVRQRLIQNAEVVGSDETFFEDDRNDQVIRDLYTENNGILDDDVDTEVDLASYAYQIWTNATDADPSLAAKIDGLPDVVYATKAHDASPAAPTGVLVYTRTPQGNDALAWIDEQGRPVTQSQLTILKAAACPADTQALARMEQHHALTEQGLAHIMEEEKSFGGALGRPSGARFKTYERLKRYHAALSDRRDLFITDEHVHQIDRALEEIYRYPLFQSATDTLNRQLKAGIGDHKLAELALNLREDGRLCAITEEEEVREPRLICTMGLAGPDAS